jgi:transglutaminase-like putative cysteine protease
MRSSLMESRPVSSTNTHRASPGAGPQPSPVPKPIARQQRLALAPIEGWLPLLLLTIAVYSVVYSVTAAITINHTTVLWVTTALGLLGGLIVSKSRFFPQAALHIGACIVGYWLALLLTSTLAFHVSIVYLLSALRGVITSGFVLTGTENSNMVFLFYLSFLCFFLGYFGSWLIYRAHLPWLVALVYVSIMIVNLNYITKRDLSFLVVILVGALILLIARVHLASQIVQWKNDGLYTDRAWMRGMTSRFLQIASLFLLLILPFSWLLPMLNQPSSGVTFWNNLDDAWANISHGNLSALSNPNTLFSPYIPSTNFFSTQLNITNTVNLPNSPVLTYLSSVPSQGQYLESVTYDTFDGHAGWNALAATQKQNYAANAPLPPDDPSAGSSTLTTTITLLQPPAGDNNYLFGPAEPSSFTVPTTLYSYPANNIVADWTQATPLTQNEIYQVTSAVPEATPAYLSAIPLPTNDATIWQNDPNYGDIQQYYLPVPATVSPEVLSTARLWTAGANNTYAAVSALQAHLSDSNSFTYSTSNDPIPANTDIVTWLLHTHKGYCTYYASAMIVMARQLGIPARMASGFSQGHYDTQKKLWVVDGSDAHSWVQIYFPGFGWINFDPTPGFSGTHLVAPSATATPAVRHTPTPTHATPTPAPHKTGTQPTPVTPPTTGNSASVDGNDGQNFLLLVSLAILLCSLIVLWFSIMRYRAARRATGTAITSIYTRLCRLARLIGSPPASWQTPYEYTFTLSQRFPQATTTLRRVADLFVRERWASPQQAPEPNEEHDLERLWPRLRNTILHIPFTKNL